MSELTSPGWEVQILEWSEGGPGILHKQDDDLVYVPTELRIRQRAGGAPIGADVIRSIQLGEALKRAVALVSRRIVRAGPEQWQLGEESPSIDRLRKVMRRESRRVTPDDLRRALDAYNEAKAAGRRDHLVHVAKECHVSRATASRWVSRALDTHEKGEI